MALLGLIPTKSNKEMNELRMQISMLKEQLGEKQSTKQSKDEKLLYEWNVESRPFVSREKSWFTSLALGFSLLVIITAIIGELILMLVIVSLLFLLFVQSLVKPERVTHKITTHGVKYIDRIYRWKELEEYWFSMKGDDIYLSISTNISVPSQLIFKLYENSVNEKKRLEKILDEFLPRREFLIINDKISQSRLSKFVDGELIEF